MNAIEVSDLQHDYVTEVINISIGKAASTMSELINDSIKMSVPRIELLPANEAIESFVSKEPRKLSGVCQKFNGCLDGEAFLLFPEENSLSIIKMMLGNSVPVNSMAELEQEALCEIGNIIINSVLGSIADLFHERIDSELPLYISSEYNELIYNTNPEDNIIMMIQVEFILESQSIKGYVSMIVNINSFSEFLKALDKHIDSF